MEPVVGATPGSEFGSGDAAQPQSSQDSMLAEEFANFFIESEVIDLVLEDDSE